MAAARKATAADFGQEVASMMTTPAKSRRKEAPVVSRRRSRKGEAGFRDRRLSRCSSSVWTPYPRLRTSSRTSCRDVSAHLNSRKSRPEAKFTVASMTPLCREAARSTERAASRHKGVMEATVNFASGRLFLEFKCAETSLQDVLEDVRSLGYGVQTEEEHLERRRSRKPASPFRDRRLLTTGASFLLLLAGVVIMLATSWPKSAAVAFMAATIVVGGYCIAANGLFTVLATRNVDMNVLMTVAVVGAEHREQAIAGHGVATDHDGGRHE